MIAVLQSLGMFIVDLLKSRRRLEAERATAQHRPEPSRLILRNYYEPSRLEAMRPMLRFGLLKRNPDPIRLLPLLRRRQCGQELDQLRSLMATRRQIIV
jgi:hypothetical protein